VNLGLPIGGGEGERNIIPLRKREFRSEKNDLPAWHKQSIGQVGIGDGYLQPHHRKEVSLDW